MAPPAPPTEENHTVENSAAISNGPIDSGGTQSWERSWTVDEMRHDAGNWSLAGDAGLLLHLKEFSQRMTTRVHEIEKEVDGLLHEAKLTSVRANNVFNDFIMLANTQFIENRVYDEDVSQEEGAKEEVKQEEQDKTREQRESELIPKVKEALALGINVIDQAFEKLDSHVADSDSEDDDDTGYRVDPILEAKDPYISRPLPLLIGTPNFIQDDNVGLAEDESEPEESDHGSISESEDEEEEGKKDDEDVSDEYSYSDSDSETEKPPKKRMITRDSSDQSESDGELFGNDKDSDEDSELDEDDDGSGDEDAKKPEEAKGPTDFAAELAKKLGAPVPKTAVSDDDEGGELPPRKEKKGKNRTRKESSGSHKKTKHADRNKEDGDLFGTGIQKDEDEDTPFGKSGGLFSGSKGLFDDSGDEGGGLFDDDDDDDIADKVKNKETREEKTKKKSGSKKPEGGVSLFDSKGDDGEDDLFNEKDKKPSKSKIKGGDFFDDEEDEEEKPRKSSKASANKVPGLFDDDESDDGDIFNSSTTKTEPESKKPKGPKLPAGAVPMFGKGPNPLFAAITKQKQTSEDEDSDISDKSHSGSLKSNQSGSSKSSLPKPVDRLKKGERSSSNNSLFDDDADDALFTSPTKPRASSKSKPVSALFDEDDDDNDGGLFGMGKPTAKPASKAKLTTEKPRSSSLFGEEEGGDDLFGGPKKSVDSGKKKPVGGVALFGGADILSKNKEEPVKQEPPVKKPPESEISVRPKKQSLSLFDEEEEEDLFGKAGGGTPSVDTKKPKSTATGKKDLFGDDDMLFGGEEEESPGVDLFGSSPDKSTPAPTSIPPKATTVSKPTPKPPEKSGMGGGLFEREEEDDLFSTPITKNKMSDKVDLDGATVTESTDHNPQEEPVQDEPVKPKKPIGGVSILGGIDPFAAMKHKRQETESDVRSKPRADSLPKPELTTPKPELTTPKPELTTPKLEVTTKPKPDGVPSKPFKAKKAAAVDSLFGDKIDDDGDDDLFGGSKSTPSFKQPPPLTMADDDDDDEDDLFSSKKSSVVTKPKPSSEKKTSSNDLFGSPKPTAVKSKPVVEVEDDIFGSGAPKASLANERNSASHDSENKGDNPKETEEEDLFGSPKEIKQAPKPWKPAGAVSMFGGMDPFSAMKKTREPEISSEKEEPVKNKQQEQIEKKAEEKKSDQPLVEDQPSSPLTKPKAVGKIGKLQFNLGINPAALLPGAGPPVKEPETVAVGFDQPAEVKTLHSVGKDRARIQTKRRPPSRHFRKSQIVDADNIPPLSSPPGGDLPISDNNLVKQPLPVLNDRVPQPTMDLFGNDDMLHDTVTKETATAHRNMKDDFADGIFSSGASQIKTKFKNDDEDDLFGNASKLRNNAKSVKVDDDIFSTSTKSSKSKTADSEEDLFNVSPIVTKTVKPNAVPSGGDDDIFSPKPRSSSKTKKKTMLEDNDDDDIFATKPKTKLKSKPDVDTGDDIFGDVSTKKEVPQEIVPPAEKDVLSNPKVDQKKDESKVDEDDIFADSTVKKTANKSKQVQNDDDDLFGKPSSAEKKKKLKKAQKTKDEVLFNDDTDIFADIPAAKTKEKKKKTPKAAGTKSVFKDSRDLDDIFGDSTPKAKPKKEKAKKNVAVTPTSTAVNSDDIFDDPLS